MWRFSLQPQHCTVKVHWLVNTDYSTVLYSAFHLMLRELLLRWSL